MTVILKAVRWPTFNPFNMFFIGVAYHWLCRVLCTTDSKVFEKSISFTEYPINQSSKLSSENILSSSSLKDIYFLWVVFVIPLEIKKAGNILHHQREGYHPPHFQMQGQKHLLNFSVLFCILNNTAISPLPCFVAILMEETVQTF